MEKSNIRIETARLDKAQLEVDAAFLSKKLAEDTADNAEARFGRYLEFDRRMDELESQAFLIDSIGRLANLGLKAANPATAIGAGLDFVLGGVKQLNEIDQSNEKRELEKFNSLEHQ
jgi:hypothetical protein